MSGHPDRPLRFALIPPRPWVLLRKKRALRRWGAAEETLVARSSPASAPDARLPVSAKLAFGIGGAAETVALYSVASFALLFYNQVLGVPAHWAGLAISASLILDGVSDPLVGSLSDRTRSKLGRRHPYMFAAPIPIGASLFAIFNPPAGLGHLGLVIWFAVFVVLLRQAMTFFHTPHLALGGELSPDYTERSKVMAYNSFCAWAGGSLTSWLALSYFFPSTPLYPRGLLNPDPWPSYALAISLVTVAVLFASAWFTRSRIPYLPKPAVDTPRFSAREFVRDLGRALSNINYVWLLVGYLFLSLMVGLREGLRLYMGTFYWGLTSEQLRWYILGSFIGFLTAFLAAARLHGRFDKKRTIIISVLIYAVAPAIPVLLGMAGVLRPGGPFLLPILVAFSVLAYGSASILAISVMSALADVADENELKHGLRQEGVLYATRSLAAKLDQAAGAMAAGFVLTLIAFPPKATPGHVPASVLHNLALWDGVIATVPGLIAIFAYARYRITRTSHEAIQAELGARRRAQAPQPATVAAGASDAGLGAASASPR